MLNAYNVTVILEHGVFCDVLVSARNAKDASAYGKEHYYNMVALEYGSAEHADRILGTITEVISYDL